MTKEPNEDENSLVNQLTENQEFLNGMGTSEELEDMNQRDSVQDAVGDFFLENLEINQEEDDQTPGLSMS